MSGPSGDLAGVADAEARLLATVGAMTDAQAGEACMLPGWTRAELVTHLARNAESHARMAEGAMRGEVVDQYPGGPAERAAAIASGRGRRAADVVVDLVRAVEWLHGTWGAMTDEAWRSEVRLRSGARPAADAVMSRWLEVEVHHADLDLGFESRDWPDAFVRRVLAPTVSLLPGRVSGGLPDATVVVWADDLAQAWVLRLGEHGLVTEPFSDVDPDALVRGPGWALLAWLLGRGSEGLRISGDETPARTLPRLFPYT